MSVSAQGPHPMQHILMRDLATHPCGTHLWEQNSIARSPSDFSHTQYPCFTASAGRPADAVCMALMTLARDDLDKVTARGPGSLSLRLFRALDSVSTRCCTRRMTPAFVTLRWTFSSVTCAVRGRLAGRCAPAPAPPAPFISVRVLSDTHTQPDSGRVLAAVHVVSWRDLCHRIIKK